LIRYEALKILPELIPKLKVEHRLRVLFGFFGALFAHIIEIWLVALA
jgi:hypothetical protein